MQNSGFVIEGFRRDFPNGAGVKIDTLEIPTGGIVAVVGTSGSGKSTLVAAIGGLIPRHKTVHGEIHYHPFDGSAPIRPLDEPQELFSRRFGFIFQSSNLLREQTTTSNLSLSTRALKEPARVDSLLKLAKRLALKPETIVAKARTLSGGEAQRVALMRVLIRDPEVIIADEPTASLDVDVAERVMEVLVEWASRPGKTLIWVTHDLKTIAEYAAKLQVPSAPDAPQLKLIVMRDGAVLEPALRRCPCDTQEIRNLIGELEEPDHAKHDDITDKLPRGGSRYIWNLLLSHRKYETFQLTSPLVQLTNYASARGEAKGTFRTISQAWHSFGQGIPVLLFSAVCLLFAVLFSIGEDIEERNEETLAGPELSNVVIGSIEDFDGDFLDDFKASAFEATGALTDGETPDLVFGRFESPVRVRPATPVSETGDGQKEFRCSSSRRSKEETLLAVEDVEQGIPQMDFLIGDTMEELSLLEPDLGPRTLPGGPLVPDANVQDGSFGAIVTRWALLEMLGDNRKAVTPSHLCLTVVEGEPELYRISGIVDNISIAPGLNYAVMISEEKYRDQFSIQGIEEPEFRNIAVYIDSDKAPAFFDFFEVLQDDEKAFETFGRQFSLERGYEKLKTALGAALFYERTVRFVMIVATVLVAAMIAMQVFFHIQRNSASFLVARAFGLRKRDLVWYQLVLSVVVWLLSVGVAVLAVSAIYYLEEFGFDLPLLDAELYKHLDEAALRTLGIAVASNVVAVALWWWRNHQIYDGIRS